LVSYIKTKKRQIKNIDLSIFGYDVLCLLYREWEWSENGEEES